MRGKGIVTHVPAKRAVNNRGDGTMFDRSRFHYDPASDGFRCPAGQTLTRKQQKKDKPCVVYTAAAAACGACALKSRCTPSRQRYVTVHLHEAALDRMHQRATSQLMRLRRCTVELPFAVLKYRIFGHPRFLLRGLAGAKIEIGLGVMVYNLKRMISVLGAAKLINALQG